MRYVYCSCSERNVFTADYFSREGMPLFLLGNVDNEVQYLGVFIDVKVRNNPSNLAIETPRLKPSTAALCAMKTTSMSGF